MKVTVEFDLMDENDAESYGLIPKMHQFHAALMDLDNKLRSELKYNQKHSADTRQLLQDLRDMIPGSLHE
jgi:hypothetical protein